MAVYRNLYHQSASEEEHIAVLLQSEHQVQLKTGNLMHAFARENVIRAELFLERKLSARTNSVLERLRVKKPLPELRRLDLGIHSTIVEKVNLLLFRVGLYKARGKR